jgi:hypothetical protein
MGAEEAKAEGAKRAVVELTARNAVLPLVLAAARAKWRTVLAENMVSLSKKKGFYFVLFL